MSLSSSKLLPFVIETRSKNAPQNWGKHSQSIWSPSKTLRCSHGNIHNEIKQVSARKGSQITHGGKEKKVATFSARCCVSKWALRIKSSWSQCAAHYCVPLLSNTHLMSPGVLLKLQARSFLSRFSPLLKSVIAVSQSVFHFRTRHRRTAVMQKPERSQSTERLFVQHVFSCHSLKPWKVHKS